MVTQLMTDITHQHIICTKRADFTYVNKRKQDSFNAMDHSLAQQMKKMAMST